VYSTVANPQFIVGWGAAADELVELLIGQDFDHQIGVVGSPASEDQPAPPYR